MSHRGAVEAICLLWLFLALLKDNGAVDVLVLMIDFKGPIYLENTTESSSRLVYKDYAGPAALCYDPAGEHIYWSNTQTHSLNRVRIDGTNFAKITDAAKCQGLVVDPTRKLLFFTESLLKKVKKMNLKKDLKGKDVKVITTLTGSDMPNYLTADFNKRMLYISVQGTNPRIEMLDYDGANKQSLKITAKRPSTIALDPTGSTLFWIDEHVANNNVNALDLKTKISKKVPVQGVLHRPYDFDVIDGKLYIIDLVQMSAYITVPVTGGEGEKHASPSSMHIFRHIKVTTYPYVCPHWTYGLGCATPCGHCKNNESCSETQGVCPNGCDQPWTGSHCDIAVVEESMLVTWICVGLGVVVIIGIAVGVFVFLKRRGAGAAKDEQMQLMR